MFGKMMRFMRLKRNFKQSYLSKKIGIADSTLAHYESQYRAITLETANEIARECNFEIQFYDKIEKKTYKFDDMKQMNYDTRVREKKK